MDFSSEVPFGTLNPGVGAEPVKFRSISTIGRPRTHKTHGQTSVPPAFQISCGQLHGAPDRSHHTIINGDIASAAGTKEAMSHNEWQLDSEA